MRSTEATVEQAGADTWAVRVERRSGNVRAAGEVLVRTQGPPDPSVAPHVRLAAARAWLGLGESALAAGSAPRAYEAGRAGLDELGAEYAPEGVKDDTQLKLLAADDLVSEGRLDDAARVVLRMLRTRSELYARRHAGDVVG